MAVASPGRPEGADPETILAELRRELRTQGASPASSEATAPERSPAETQLPQDGFLSHVREMQALWAIQPRPFSSRLPVVGPLVARLRTLWNEVATRWYLQPILQQQVDFNASVVRMAQYLEPLLRVLEGETRALRLEAREYDQANLAFTRRFAQLELVMQSLTSTIEQLQRTADPEQRMLLEPRLARLEATFRGIAPGQPPASGGAQEPPPDGQVVLPDYLAFEQRFRGPTEQVKENQRPYVDYFSPPGLVVDLGCGRGEFLELLREAGIPARGVESNGEMVAYCRERALDVEHADLFTFLAAQTEESLGGVFLAQVIEHLPPPKLLELLHLCYQKLSPGGVLVAETINPMCVVALVSHFTIDLSHCKPIHPETALFLAQAVGFADARLHYTSPVPERGRLQPIEPAPQAGAGDWRTVFNENVRKLNDLLYTYQDYALVARKLPETSG